jgi:hypothetical protein
MEGESGELGLRQNRKGREQDQGWRSARPEEGRLWGQWMLLAR